MTQQLSISLIFPSTLFVVVVVLPLCLWYCVRAGFHWRNLVASLNIFTARNYFQCFIFMSLASQLIFNFWMICLYQRQSVPQLLWPEAVGLLEPSPFTFPLSVRTIFCVYLSTILAILAFTLRFVVVAKCINERFRFRLTRLSGRCSSLIVRLLPFFIFIFMPAVKLVVVVIALVFLFK